MKQNPEPPARKTGFIIRIRQKNEENRTLRGLFLWERLESRNEKNIPVKTSEDILITGKLNLFILGPNRAGKTLL
jgi:hypothetical protein